MTTSRERVLSTLSHEKPDRIPVDCSGHRSSGIPSMAYPKLRAALGLEPRTVYVYDPVQQLAIMHDDALERFGVDAVEMGRGFCLEGGWWEDWTLPGGTPCKMQVWALPENIIAMYGAVWECDGNHKC
jgi:uroporphyrinogen decarboxylase